MRASPGASAGFAQWCVILFLVFSVLWKGGKGIETAWLLVALAFVVILVSMWPKRKSRLRVLVETAEGMVGIHPDQPQTRTVPWSLWLPLAGFVLWSMVSYRLSLTGNYGLDEVMRDGAFALLFCWAVRQPVHMDRQDLSLVERLLYTLALATVAACVLGVVVYVFQPVNRFVGSFFDYRYHTDYWPNAWAEFALLAWPMVAWLAGKMRFAWGTVLLGAVLGCLFLSYSRGAFLVFLGQLVLLALLIVLPWLVSCMSYLVLRKAPVENTDDERKTKNPSTPLRAGSERKTVLPLLRLAAAAVAGIIVFACVNLARSRFYEVESVTRKATLTAQEGRSSVDERRQFWEQSLELAQERPLFGWGPYSFRFIQPRLEQGVFQTSDHPHNVFLKLAMERGWPASLLLLAFIACILTVAMWRLGTGAFSEPLRSVLMLSVVAVTGVFVHNLIDYNLQFVGITLPFWLLLGCIVALSWMPPKKPSRERVRQACELGLATFLLVIALWEGSFLVLSSIGRRSEAAGRTDEAIRRYAGARRQLFSRDLHISRTALLLDRGRIDDAERSLQDYFVQNAEDARAWRLKGDIAFLRKRYDEAMLAYDRALWRGKYNDLGILYSMLKTLSIERNTETIARRKAEFDSLLQTYAQAIMGNVHYIALSTNVEQLRDTADLLSLLYPDDAQRYRLLSEEVVRNAKKERERLSARSQGYLW